MKEKLSQEIVCAYGGRQTETGKLKIYVGPCVSWSCEAAETMYKSRSQGDHILGVITFWGFRGGKKNMMKSM
jgi:hypothetical protein